MCLMFLYVYMRFDAVLVSLYVFYVFIFVFMCMYLYLCVFIVLSLSLSIYIYIYIYIYLMRFYTFYVYFMCFYVYLGAVHAMPVTMHGDGLTAHDEARLRAQEETVFLHKKKFTLLCNGIWWMFRAPPARNLAPESVGDFMVPGLRSMRNCSFTSSTFQRGVPRPHRASREPQKGIIGPYY